MRFLLEEIFDVGGMFVEYVGFVGAKKREGVLKYEEIERGFCRLEGDRKFYFFIFFVWYTYIYRIVWVYLRWREC